LTRIEVAAAHDSTFGLDTQLDQIERASSRLFPWLRFPPDVERTFQAAAQAKRLRLITATHAIGMVLYTGLLISDALLTPDVLELGLILRLLVFPALILTGLGLLHRWRSPAIHEWAVAVAGMVAMTLHAMSLMLTDSPMAMLRVVETNLLVIFTCTVARFWPAVTACAFAMCLHGLEMWILPDATGVLKFCLSILLLASVVFTLYANYRMELDERLAYLLTQRENLLDEALYIEHDRMARLATEDALTGVANRRSFEQYLQDSAVRAQTQGLWLSLIMVDIDHFKRYNDLHGHQAGDRCLKAVAGAMAASMRRPVDLVARLGGEEFAVVMPEADPVAARAAAERVRQAVQALSLSHPASSTSTVVTISVGVTSGQVLSQVDGQSLSTDLVLQADEALYRAKERGRNRVVAATDPSAVDMEDAHA
jgi:diguanylate cyclase (GGDEF)-like protein